MDTFNPKEIENQIIEAKKTLRKRAKDYYKNFQNIKKFITDEVNEINYKDRATIDNLSDLGKKQLGLLEW